MNKSKTIYFLSAVVLIIGCYVLNLSYSLFVQTEEKEIVSASVPGLSYTFDEYDYVVPATTDEETGYVVAKLIINNTGSADMKYAISIPDLPSGITAKLVDKDGNEIEGTLTAGSVTEVWVYLENATDEDLSVIFSIKVNYANLNIDNENSKIDTANKHKLAQTLLYNVLTSAKTAANNNNTTRTQYNENISDSTAKTGPGYTISNSSDRYLSIVQDQNVDYEILNSYYFRGNVNDNYVSFAGMCWRIVRINEDGTAKLVLSSSYATCEEQIYDDESALISSGQWGYDGSFGEMTPNFSNGGYVVLNNWYTSSGLSNYESKIIKNTWCTGDSLYNYDLSYYMQYYYSISFAGYEYITKRNGYTSVSCEYDIEDTYYSYVGLLNVGEVINAGGLYGTNNSNYYLIENALGDWWTMTYASYLVSEEQLDGYIYTIDSAGAINGDQFDSNGGVYFRPAIVLNSDVTVTGTGTITDPYIVQ